MKTYKIKAAVWFICEREPGSGSYCLHAGIDYCCQPGRESLSQNKSNSRFNLVCFHLFLHVSFVINSFTHWFIHLFIFDSFIYSFIHHLFIHSFIPSVCCWYLLGMLYCFCFVFECFLFISCYLFVLGGGGMRIQASFIFLKCSKWPGTMLIERSSSCLFFWWCLELCATKKCPKHVHFS